MTPRQRLNAVFAGKPVDHVPIIIPGGMMAGVLYDIINQTGLPYPGIHTNAEYMVRYTRYLQEKCGLDNTGVPFCMTVEAEDFGAEVCLGNALHEPSIAVQPYNSLSELLRVTPVISHRHLTTLKAIQQLTGGDIPVIGNIVGPMSLLTSLVQQGMVFRAMENDKNLLKSALALLGDYISRFAEEQLAAGADITVIADPSAAGEIIGPDYFETFLAPVYETMLNRIRQKGKPIILHICGRILNLAPILKSLNWNGLSVDSLVNLRTLEEMLAGRLLMGNVSTQIMAGSGVEKTYRSTRHIVETTAILSPACGLSTKTPLNNIKAMVQAAEDAAIGLERLF